MNWINTVVVKLVETSGKNSFGVNLKLFERRRKHFGGDSSVAGADWAYGAFQGSRLTSDWSAVTGEETMIPTVAADGKRNRLCAEGRAARRNAGPLCARAGALLTIRISWSGRQQLTVWLRRLPSGRSRLKTTHKHARAVRSRGRGFAAKTKLSAAITPAARPSLAVYDARLRNSIEQ